MIFFDIDDTLTDSVSAHKNAINQLANRYNLTLDNVDWSKKKWIEITDFYLHLYFKNEISLEDQRAARLTDFWQAHNADLSRRDASLAYSEYHQIFLKHCSLYPDVKPNLRPLQNVKIGIISNGVVNDQLFKLRNNGILKLFSPVVISEEVGYQKPASEIFTYALRQAQVPASHCVYIGNSYHIDYVGAINSGLNSIWIDRLNEGKELSTTNRVDSFAKAVALALQIIPK